LVECRRHPFLKYKSLLNLKHDLTAEEIDSIGILKNSTFHYELKKWKKKERRVYELKKMK